MAEMFTKTWIRCEKSRFVRLAKSSNIDRLHWILGQWWHNNNDLRTNEVVAVNEVESHLKKFFSTFDHNKKRELTRKMWELTQGNEFFHEEVPNENRELIIKGILQKFGLI